MTSIKVKFRPSSVTGQEGTIYYRIIHERIPRQIISQYHIFPFEWDKRQSTVKVNRLSNRRQLLESISEGVRTDVERLKKIIFRLDAAGLSYSTGEVIDEFKRFKFEYSLFNYMEKLIDKLKLNGRIRTSETYSATLRSFKKFRNGKDLMLDTLNSETMEAFEAWHQRRGVIPNTISFYNRILRAVYNRAVEDGGIENKRPFRHVYTGVDKTVKRALPIQEIKKIKVLDLSRTPELDYARDIFIMSFMLRGMSLIDMAYLQKSDRTNGYITYRRRKTGKQMTIGWTEEMQMIIDKYPSNKTHYLLPILYRYNNNDKTAYRKVFYFINNNLKKIERILNYDFRLTMYVARHSWASAARAKGIPLSIISEGMGHNSEKTTQIYLSNLDSSAIDKANSIILKSLT